MAKCEAPPRSSYLCAATRWPATTEMRRSIKCSPSAMRTKRPFVTMLHSWADASYPSSYLVAPVSILNRTEEATPNSPDRFHGELSVKRELIDCQERLECARHRILVTPRQTVAHGMSRQGSNGLSAIKARIGIVSQISSKRGWKEESVFFTFSIA